MQQTPQSGRRKLPLMNGVDLEQLMETIRAIQKQPELARFQFRATNRWLEGPRNQIEVRDFFGACQERPHERPFRFEADEPQLLLGQDRAANPVEYVLTALSACLTTTLAYYAAVNGIEIDGIESSLEGDLDLHGFLGLDPEVRNGFKEIRVNFKVKSDADRSRLEELAKKSPVFDIVTHATPVRIEVRTEPRLQEVTKKAA